MEIEGNSAVDFKPTREAMVRALAISRFVDSEYPELSPLQSIFIYGFVISAALRAGLDDPEKRQAAILTLANFLTEMNSLGEEEEDE